MTYFVDTSALFAVLDADDINHAKAEKTWKKLLQMQDSTLVCSNYILVESFALIQNRLGLTALKLFQEDIVPVLLLHWIDEVGHGEAAMSVLTANRKNLSLVDCTSFILMRKLGIKHAFTFDRHFKEQGFVCL